MENQETKNSQEPHVRIFNEEYNGHEKEEDKNKKCDGNGMCSGTHYHYHRHHSGGGIFGLAVLFAGILLLLTNFGLVTKDVWQYIWPFWPVLLILAGVRIIFAFNRFMGFLVFLLALALFYGITVYALMQVGSPLVAHLYVPQGWMNLIGQYK